MYSVIFESDTGEIYRFGKDGGSVFDMNLGEGVPVDIGTSQGFSQIGTIVQRRTISGRNITVKGVVFDDIQKQKRNMRKIINPLSKGRLIFENKYYTRVFVENAPSFSAIKNDGRFSMRFFAPFPFFYDVNLTTSEIGSIDPKFSFPINYSDPHKFGEKSSARYNNIVNEGDISVPFSVYLRTRGTSSNIVITNLNNFQTLKLNGVLNAGEIVNIYRDENNILRAELNSNGVITDIMARIDESSTLFELQRGDNLISANDDEGGASLVAKITFSPAVVALYED